MNSKNVLRWEYKHFNKLTAGDLHALLALRCSVFIIEQNCPYLDPDNKDLNSYHVMGWEGNNLVAVARIVEPGISYVEVSVGRVATSSAVRGTGTGKGSSVERKVKFFDVPCVNGVYKDCVCTNQPFSIAY